MCDQRVSDVTKTGGYDEVNMRIGVGGVSARKYPNCQAADSFGSTTGRFHHSAETSADQHDIRARKQSAHLFGVLKFRRGRGVPAYDRYDRL